MAEYLSVRMDELYLDPHNRRLGLLADGKRSQAELMECLLDWNLNSLVRSYLENGGYWADMPLMVVREMLYGSRVLVVLDGNRRLAALKWLASRMGSQHLWSSHEVPCYLVQDRSAVQIILGARHMTGREPKQWLLEDRVRFLVHLLEELDYPQLAVASRLGVSQHLVWRGYQSYKLIKQFGGKPDDYWFHLLYQAIDFQPVRRFLIIPEPPEVGLVPDHLYSRLNNLMRWLTALGSSEVSVLARALDNEAARHHLETVSRPDLSTLWSMVGGRYE